jgi:hypothetical protein
MAAGYLDDRRSERELAASERLGWRITLADGRSFPDIDLTNTDLSFFQLPGRDFTRANFNGARLESANLRDGNFQSAQLIGADLSNAILSGASFIDADLVDANMAGATLYDADLSGVDLNMTHGLDSAVIVKACYDSLTLWPVSPPQLSWEGCRGEHSPDGVSGTDRGRVDEYFAACEADVDSLWPYFQHLEKWEDSACSYLSFLYAKGYPERMNDHAFSGGYVCTTLEQGPQGRLTTSIEGLSLHQTNTLALAAVEFLCPEHRDILGNILLAATTL